MDKIRTNIVLIVPFVISVYAVLMNQLLLSFLSLVLVLGAVGVAPICRRRESLWIFVIATFTSLPINILFSYGISQSEIGLLLYDKFFSIIVFIVIYSALFSFEQILLGVAGRMIWRRQYKLVFIRLL